MIKCLYLTCFFYMRSSDRVSRHIDISANGFLPLSLGPYLWQLNFVISTMESSKDAHTRVLVRLCYDNLQQYKNSSLGVVSSNFMVSPV